MLWAGTTSPPIEENAPRRGAALVVERDLSTPVGEFLSSVMAAAAQWERRIIGQRTKDALASKKAQGILLGRPRVVDEAFVCELANGTLWQESSVRKLLQR